MGVKNPKIENCVTVWILTKNKNMYVKIHTKYQYVETYDVVCIYIPNDMMVWNVSRVYVENNLLLIPTT